MLKRAISLEQEPKRSFWLWGPRQTGKSTLLTEMYPRAYRVDLLQAVTCTRLLEEPWQLRKELEEEIKKGTRPLVIIDEIQKVPQLLDEVHWMIENMGLVFGLCGSSARKVRRGQANLLGGRALRNELWGLTRIELGTQWNLEHALNFGSLPAIALAENPAPLLDAYVGTYLKEEILQEGIVRRLPPFANVLRAVAFSDGNRISYTTIGRDCGVSNQTVRDYVQIMEDTLIGSFVPAYIRRPKRRIIRSPKFYLFDVGVVNTLAQRGRIVQKSPDFGKALENWIHHELRTYASYRHLRCDIRYWQDRTGAEVDFIIGDMDTAIEVKATDHARDHHMKSLRVIAEDYAVKQRILVCLESHAMRTEDGIRILPVEEFLQELWGGKILR